MIRIALLFLLSIVAATAAKADSLLAVAITTAQPPILEGGETNVTLTFTWDTTTNGLSNVDLQTVGPLVFSDVPSEVLYDGDSIENIAFSDSAGDLLQFEYNSTGFNLQPIVGSGQPGLFDIDCSSNAACTNGGPELIFFHGETVITNVAEPQTAELLLFGLLALGIAAYRRD
jgi:hypothetical protein